MSESTPSPARRAAWSVLLWLLVPAGAQLGVSIYDALNPAAVGQPDAPPPSVLFGVIGLAVGVGAAIAASVWLKLGVVWFGVALLVAALLAVLALAVPAPLLVVLLLLIPPLAGAWVQRKLDRRQS